MAQEPILIACLLSKSDKTGLPGGFSTELIAEIEILGVKQPQRDGGHLAFPKTLAGALVSADAFVTQLAAPEWRFAGVPWKVV